jgi:superfamily I DNA/RNA helicase
VIARGRAATGEGETAQRWRADAADRDLDAVMVLFDAAARFADRLPGARTEVFLDHVLGQDLPADTLAPSADRGEAVRLLTLHAAKGLEWDLVAVAGVQEGIWPDPAARQPARLRAAGRRAGRPVGRRRDRGERGGSDLGVAGRGAPALPRRDQPGPAPAAGQRRGVGRRRR